MQKILYSTSLFLGLTFSCLQLLHAEPIDYTTLDIEELVNIPVTSVSKKEERGFEAPAAIFVLTHDDIRKSGATSIPEALRLVPGLHVAKINAHSWSISARGFGGRFANKLLVLIDGRSVYTPLFSGVYWDVQDTLLEDIDRIEVIRGPGATLWGSNAVNGVINIVTKSAYETEGGLVQGRGGSEDLGAVSLRYGEKLSEDTAFRIYGKYFERDEHELDTGGDGHDSWSGGQVGFRLDSRTSDRDEVTLQGDLYTRDEEQVLTGFANLTGPIPVERSDREDVDAGVGNILFRWNRALEEDSDLTFQTYWNRNRREDFAGIDQTIDEIDFDFQHRLQFAKNHEGTWGVGYRLITDSIANTDSSVFADRSDTFSLVTGFVQDKYTVIPEKLVLTLGTKLEHNDFSGFEIQPGARLGWNITDRDFFWTSFTRAVRTPNRLEQDGTFFTFSEDTLPDGTPLITQILNNPQLEAENLLAYEAGFRKRFDYFLFDLSVFYNNYDSLRTFVPSTMPIFLSQTGPLPVLPVTALNASAADSYGGEVTVEFTPASWLRLQGSYWYFRIDFESQGTDAQVTPRNQALLRAILSLCQDVDLSGTARYVDQIISDGIDSYITADLRVGWRATKDLEFMIVGQNLIEDSHLEFQDDASLSPLTRNQRAVYGGFTWTFQ